jgi:predicted RND superfamily exporter protein
VGTLAILLLSFTFVPALLSLANEKRLVAAASEEPGSRPGGRILSWLGRMAVGRSGVVFAAGLVLLLLVLEYRSVSVGLVAFLPLLFTTALIYGAVGFLGKDFDMPISVLSTLSLGMAIDFSIHFVSRLSQQTSQAATAGLDELLLWTVERPGLGIVRNAAVFALGFAVIALSSLTPYITVGVFMAAIMLLSSVATLVYLPAIFKRFPRLLTRKESP